MNSKIIIFAEIVVSILQMETDEQWVLKLME